MDKEWMSKDRLSREYEFGVEYFLQFSLRNATDADAIPCPCAKCGNLKKKNVETIRAHMYCNGIDLTYHTWIWHGERCTIWNSKNESDQVGPDEQKFVDEEPIDMVHAVYDKYADDPTKFSKLLEDVEKPLYPECTKFTRLSAVVKLFNLKAKYSWCDKIFTDLLSLLGEMLPDNNDLPLSLYDAKKSLCAFGMDYVKIYACPNDCVSYRKKYDDFTNCPTCGMSRWKLGQKNTIKEGVPAKIYGTSPIFQDFKECFGIRRYLRS